MADPLQQMIDRLGALEAAPELVAKELAIELERDLRKQIASGTDPEGVKWPARKDGEPALQNAGKALTVKAHGTVVVAQLSGPTALHHLGMGKGGVRRKILPQGVPARLVEAAQRVLVRLAQSGKV
jgi:hypothetical protein